MLTIGASTGIGRATVEAFAGAGWRVAATMRRPEKASPHWPECHWPNDPLPRPDARGQAQGRECPQPLVQPSHIRRPRGHGARRPRDPGGCLGAAGRSVTATESRVRDGHKIHSASEIHNFWEWNFPSGVKRLILVCTGRGQLPDGPPSWLSPALPREKRARDTRFMLGRTGQTKCFHGFGMPLAIKFLQF